MIRVPIDKKTGNKLINLKLEDKMSCALMSYVCYDGKNVIIEETNMDELKLLASVVNNIIISHNNNKIAHLAC